MMVHIKNRKKRRIVKRVLRVTTAEEVTKAMRRVHNGFVTTCANKTDIIKKKGAKKGHRTEHRRFGLEFRRFSGVYPIDTDFSKNKNKHFGRRASRRPNVSNFEVSKVRRIKVRVTPSPNRDTVLLLTGWAHDRHVLDFPQLSVARTGHGGRKRTRNTRSTTGSKRDRTEKTATHKSR